MRPAKHKGPSLWKNHWSAHGNFLFCVSSVSKLDIHKYLCGQPKCLHLLSNTQINCSYSLWCRFMSSGSFSNYKGSTTTLTSSATISDLESIQSFLEWLPARRNSHKEQKQLAASSDYFHQKRTETEQQCQRQIGFFKTLKQHLIIVWIRTASPLITLL